MLGDITDAKHAYTMCVAGEARYETCSRRG